MPNNQTARQLYPRMHQVKEIVSHYYYAERCAIERMNQMMYRSMTGGADCKGSFLMEQSLVDRDLFLRKICCSEKGRSDGGTYCSEDR